MACSWVPSTPIVEQTRSFLTTRSSLHLDDSKPLRKPDQDTGEAGFGVGVTDWLVGYQPWLTLLARLEIDSCFQGKFDPSDIVQQTMMEAWRAAPKFRGETEPQRLAWLRQILAHVLAHEVRRYRGTQMRDVGREISIHQSLTKSSQRLGDVLATAVSTPSKQVSTREQELLLADVLESLPEDYREVIILRNLEGLSHDEVARRMGRNVGAVRMLWVRALERMRKQLSDLEQ
jgi:RNA polymerase sigma-70 factor (ECF subfamily)